MGIHITAGTFELALGYCRYADSDLVFGPLKAWWGWDMQGIAWDNRFDLIIERTGYRPEAGQWFETWQVSPEERGGFLFGRKWNLLTGSRVKNRWH